MILKVTRDPDGSTYYENEVCVLRITGLAPHVTLHTLNGIGTPDLFTPIAADIERTLLFHKRCVVLVDAYDERVRRYELSNKLIAFLRGCRGRDLRLVVLVRTTLVDMAVSIGNLLAGASFVRIYWDITEWEDAARKEVPGFRRRPILRRAQAR